MSAISDMRAVNKPGRTLVESRPFSYDAQTGIRTTFHYWDDDTYTLEKTQDAAPLIEHNTIIANADDGRWKQDGQGARVASIPLILWSQLRQQGIIDDRDPKQTRFRKWLNDRDNRMFRTKPGRV